MGEPEWGPWEKHDGSGIPAVPVGRWTINVRWHLDAALIEPEDDFEASQWPGFFWRWKRVRVGWFRTELRRVCDDPAYAPIIAYRLRKPRSSAVDRLAEIAASPPGQWIKDATDSDPRLPKRVKA